MFDCLNNADDVITDDRRLRDLERRSRTAKSGRCCYARGRRGRAEIAAVPRQRADLVAARVRTYGNRMGVTGICDRCRQRNGRKVCLQDCAVLSAAGRAHCRAVDTASSRG